jgi:hypothetical protein
MSIRLKPAATGFQRRIKGYQQVLKVLRKAKPTWEQYQSKTASKAAEFWQAIQPFDAADEFLTSLIVRERKMLRVLKDGGVLIETEAVEDDNDGNDYEC